MMLPRSLSVLMAVPLLASALAAQLPASRSASPATLPYDSITVRALLADAVSAARQAPLAERSSLLSAIGRTQVVARDYDGAARTLRLVDDESPTAVMRQLGEPERFAGLFRAGLARRLSCALRDADRPAEALAVIRDMRPGENRDWELEFAAELTARGAAPPAAEPRTEPPRAERGREALRIAAGIDLPAARLDALLGIARAMPDTGPARVVLEQAYTGARRITLADADRQRSRDAMLASVALRLHRTDDARAFYARLTSIDDLLLVVAAAATDAAPFAHELAPRAISAVRAVRDSAARATNLVALWQQLGKAGGRAYADSLLPEARSVAERQIDLRAMLDSVEREKSGSPPAVMMVGTPGDTALPDAIEAAIARRAALRANARHAIAAGDSASARRQLLALLNERGLLSEEEANGFGNGLPGDLVRAGGWREAIAWARRSPTPAARARRLIGIAAQLQRNVAMQEGRGMIIANGPSWCEDELQRRISIAR